MKFAQFFDQHFLSIGTLGTAGGVTSWLLNHAFEIQGVAAVVGAVAGAVTAVLTGLLFALRIIYLLRDRRRIEKSVEDYERDRRDPAHWGSE